MRAVAEWEAPRSISELHAFVGLCSYYRRFVRHFARIAECLHDLTKNARFCWQPMHEAAFNELKALLKSVPMLTLPNDTDTSVLDADASDVAVCTVLSQIQYGQERVIAYASRRYSDALS